VLIRDVQEAAKRIRPYAHITPLLTSAFFDHTTGLNLYFKCENFQKVGAFKIRGACNAVFGLTKEEAAKGVVTHSSGNHAQALALAAKLRGIKATVVMPKNAPVPKCNAVKDYGANIVFSGPSVESREETCKIVQQREGAVFIAPYDNVMVIAGQGTVALEILQQVHDLDAIVAPVSGGGLLSGICVGAKAIKSSIHIFGAEPTGADDAYRSLKSGQRVLQTNPQTICDGLRSSLGEITWPIIKENVTDILTATDDEVKNAMFLLWERMKIVVEPSGAISCAVVLNPNFKKKYPHLKKIALVLSGGNVDLKDWKWDSKL